MNRINMTLTVVYRGGPNARYDQALAATLPYKQTGAGTLLATDPPERDLTWEDVPQEKLESITYVVREICGTDFIRCELGPTLAERVAKTLRKPWRNPKRFNPRRHL